MIVVWSSLCLKLIVGFDPDDRQHPSHVLVICYGLNIYIFLLFENIIGVPRASSISMFFNSKKI